MARTIKSKEIEGVLYEVHQLGASEGLSILMDLVKLLGPALGPVLESGALESVNLGLAVRTLCESLDKAKVKTIVDAMARSTTAVGVGRLDGAFEAHFAGRMGLLLKWLSFAVGAQYDDFFGSLADAVKSVGGAVKAAPPMA